MKGLRYLEIVPRNGSHYLVMDGREISRHDDVQIAEAVREEILRQQFAPDSADGGGYGSQNETRAGQSSADTALCLNHDDTVSNSKC